MTFSRASLVTLLLGVVATWPAPAAGHESGIPLTPVRAKFPERSFLVTLPRDVALKPGLVRVWENGELVPQVAVGPTGGATGSELGVALVIDASESMAGNAIAGAMKAARVFAGRRKAGQQLGVVVYNAKTEVLLPFTTDGARIREALATTPRVAYYTRMYDAVEEAVSLIRAERLKHGAIVLLSDGQELDSKSTLEAATASARTAGIRIFTVALRSRFFDSTALKSLAASTGGEYFEANSPNALVGIYRRLGRQLANEYLIQYRSFAGPNERVHVQVAVTGFDGTAAADYRSPRLPGTTTVSPVFRRSIVDKIIQSALTMLVLGLLIATLLALAAAALIRPRASGLRTRLGAFVAVGSPGDPKRKRQTAVLSEKLLEGTERGMRRMRVWNRVKEELEIAEISLPAEQIVVLAALGTVLLMWILSIIFNLAFALLAFLTPLLVRMYIKQRADRQRRAFADQLPDNLQVLSSALRAGHSLIGALSVVVDDAPEPSRREFKSVVADEQLGVALEDALTNVAERMNNRDLEQVALVAALQRETGANSAEVLDRVAETIRERAALRRLVRTLTAQGRMARWIVSALPAALLVVVSLLNPEYMTPMYTRTAGQIMLAFAAIMVVSGSLVIRRIVDIRV
jgi:tight adherence protein B